MAYCYMVTLSTIVTYDNALLFKCMDEHKKTDDDLYAIENRRSFAADVSQHVNKAGQALPTMPALYNTTTHK